MMQAGSYWERSRAEKERLSPKLHHLTWMTLNDVLAQADPSVPFINSYQQEQFLHYNVRRRTPGREMLGIIERIAKLGTLRNVRQQSLENMVRVVAEAKQLPEEQWKAQLEEDVGIMKGVNEITLLSYNLNCLPLGAKFVNGGALGGTGWSSHRRCRCHFWLTLSPPRHGGGCQIKEGASKN